MTFKMKTKDGYDYYEVISALQKDIRRGKEEEALFWALQLAEGNFMPHLLNRLPIIASEDIGICDGGTTIILVDTLVRQIREYHKKKNDGWRLMLANAILAMCRVEKSREAENFQTVVRHKMKKGERLEIPDFALDMHTLRGKRTGRGIKFFVENEQQIEILKNPGRNDYVEEANAIESGETPGSEEPNEVPQVSLFGEEDGHT